MGDDGKVLLWWWWWWVDEVVEVVDVRVKEE